jgi:ParB-like chromosome segregation protein Spo0J
VSKDGRFALVAGRHRLEAFRVLGEERIPATVLELSDVDARLWEIAENLHRVELSITQRMEQVAEYARLVEEKREAEQAAQLAHPDPRYEKRGDSAAARDLGISRDEVRRARAIASLPEETKQAAREAGLDDNQSALLKAAKAETPVKQIEVLNEIAERGSVAAKQRARPLHNLIGISGGELARWVKITTPNDRPRAVRLLRMAADLLEDELEAIANGPHDSVEESAL